ncbi:MAG: hypothetical protein K8U57_24950 [Planctomycetes bacterium]|nr:hypothetical protein [Planctomycetota bacterium]
MSFGKAPSSVLLTAVAAACFACLGCKPGVREDRSITFGPDGRVAFQHGGNGVFVTDAKSGKPKRIYEPVAGDMAFSPPIWNPDGKRMVFTVARALGNTPTVPVGDAPANGRQSVAVPVRYTCFLHDPAIPDSNEKLFEATASHAGYVAAGLAVSWHADGRGLDFVEQEGTQHRVSSFDLTTRQRNAVPLAPADHVVLGTGRGQRFALLGGAATASGLWIEGDGTWWRVPDSEPGKHGLESLRSRIPQWSRDGKKLAFVDGTAVRVCDPSTRQTETWFRSESPLSSLHWHPDGSRVGLIDGSRLVLVGPAGELRVLTAPLAPEVVAFAGWDASGQWMACVATGPLPYRVGAAWATLFVPNANARTVVCVADADGANAKPLVTGLRATFPNWSPTEPRLSVWLTVEPPYRLAEGRVGMRPGDPAVLIDPSTGKLDWLPVNGTEHAQIGHAELRAGRLDEALRRFDEATAALPVDAKADWMLFRAIALKKAGRAADSQAAWRRFAPPTQQNRDRALYSVMRVADPRLPPLEPEMILPRHQYAAEAFVSLEMAADGIEFFRHEVREVATDVEKLSATVALCQLLLLTDKKAEYAECVVDQLLPLSGQILSNPATSRTPTQSVAWTLLPLAVREFTAPLPEQLVRRVSGATAAWPQGGDIDFVCQWVSRTCGGRLKDVAMTERASKRLLAHPARDRWNLDDGGVNIEFLWRIRAAFLIEEQLRETFGAEPAR